MMEWLKSLPLLEVVCGLALLYGLVKGWMNGLIKELCSTAGFAVGCVLAYMAYTHYGLGLGWTLLVCIAFPLVLGLVASLLSSIIEHIFVVGKLNKLLGALVGCAKYGLLIGFILLLIDKAQEWKNLLL